MIFNISGFEILDKIGQGGMASVWKARQLSLDRIVAIKILSEGFSGELEDVRRFQDEAQAAAKLKHPGIVLVHDANAENGTYYFVMEYVSGYTVGDWVRRKGVLSEKDALLVADCVADALGYAWGHANIVHCDIKPDNIIIDEDGTVKVADLGLARTISVMEMDSEEAEEVMGTPAYISPEQAMGETNLDFRADIYSLGAMLYHLVTGKMMFEELSDDETLENQVNGRVDDPIDINPSLSKGICWLIERMMAKDPAMREDSWEAVRADINRVRSGLLPKGKVLPDDASTVRRSARRTVDDYKRVAKIQHATGSATSNKVVAAIKIAVIAVALAVAARLYMQSNENSVPVVAEQAAETNIVDEAEVDSEEVEVALDDSIDIADDSQVEVMDMETVRAKEMYDFAVVWQKKHRDDIKSSIEQFNAIVDETRGTKYSLMAQQEIRKLEDQLADAIQAAVRDLDSQVIPLVEGHKYKKAITLLKKYDGPYSKETLGRRLEISKRLEVKSREWQENQRELLNRQSKEMQRRLDSLVMAVLADDLNLSIQLTQDMTKNRVLKSLQGDLKQVLTVLEEASKVSNRIIESFESQYGEVLDVYLVDGKRTLKIGTVSEGRVECMEELSVGYGGVSTYSIGFDDLSDYERLQRIGDESDYEVALVKGIMAFQSHAYSHAEKYFGMTHPLLAKHLLMKLRGEGEEPEIVEIPEVAPEPLVEERFENNNNFDPMNEDISDENRRKRRRDPIFEEGRKKIPINRRFEKFKETKEGIWSEEDGL